MKEQKERARLIVIGEVGGEGRKEARKEGIEGGRESGDVGVGNEAERGKKRV